MYKIPELLAPAGGLEQLKAAVENGADAVYMGGKLFNARINADNFSDEEMQSGIEYAGMRGAKTYVTMNTLLSDGELYEGLKYAEKLYEYGADAIILQELSLGQLIRKYIPGLDIHLSTQGTIYNIEGIRKAKELGFSRVVLARELSLTEMKALADEKLLELEVFVHGALCICYSGQCQMSREIGGRSGNRGSCAQPCRLPYSLYQDQKGEKKELEASSFALSPKDLCTIDYLDKLAETGMDSLKIEGRMKSPEYVAIVTGLYRKYLDRYSEEGHYQVAPEDLKALNQIYNRGGFTRGYLLGKPGKNLMSGKLSKHQGIYIGKVAEETSFEKKGPGQGGLVQVMLTDDLALGDVVEIRNDELSGNRVTYMNKKGSHVKGAKAGERVTIGYIDGKMAAGQKVYKMVDKNLLEKARESYQGKSGMAEKNLRKANISFQFKAGLRSPAILQAEDEEGNLVIKEMAGIVEMATAKGLQGDRVKEQLLKTGGTPFRVQAVELELEEGIHIPISKINDLRRLVLDELEEIRKNKPSALRRDGRKIPSYDILFPRESQKGSSEEEKDSNKASRISLYLWKAIDHMEYDFPIHQIYLPYDEVLKGYSAEGIKVIPVIPNVTRGWHDEMIAQRFHDIVTASKDGIAVGNLGWIEPFVKEGLDVFGDYGLNLYNSMDFLLMKEMGLKGGLVAHDLSIEEMSTLDFHGLVPEVAIEGRIPVMTTEYCILDGYERCGKQGRCQENGYYLKDRKGADFPVVFSPQTCQSLILSHKERKWRAEEKILRNYGVRNFRVYQNPQDMPLNKLE